jgi:Rod binding domain-containing protein
MIKPIAAALNRLQAPAQTPQAIHAEAKKFEAMAIAQFLKPMFQTMGHAEAPFGAGKQFQAFQPIFLQAVASDMEARGGLGLATAIEASLTESAQPTHPKP